ncbi:MAG: tetratricopeptide repeat protein [Candidatus Zixiibacteriota bacterium]|nr:MAG: tetratricopeptide repeat protein [candidate division Zixibacteria bacterium]
MRKSLCVIIAALLCVYITSHCESKAQNQTPSETPTVTATAETSTAMNVVPPIRDLFDNGYYDSVVSITRATLAESPDRLGLLYWEVRSAFLGEAPKDYISAAFSSEKTDIVNEMRHAMVLYYQGWHREAFRAFEGLEQKYPDECFIKLFKGRTADAMGLDAVAESSARAATRDPDCFGLAYRTLLFVTRSLGRFDESNACIDSIAPLPGFAVGALCSRAWNVGYRGDWQTAIKMLTDSRDTLRDPDLYRSLSRMYNHIGYYNEAIKTLEEARNIWPKNKYIYEGLSWVYGRVGREKASLDAIRDFNAVNMQYCGASSRLTAAFDLKDTMAIEQACRALLTDYYDYTYPARAYIDWLDNRQRQQEADSIVQRFAESAAVPVEAEVRAARIDQDSPVEALAIIDSLLPEWKRYDYLRRRRIQLMFESGQIEKAQALVDDFLQKRPGDMNFVVNMAETEFGRNNRKEALAWLDRGERLAPGSYDLGELRLRILMDEKKWDEAATLLDKLASEYPDNYYLLYQYTVLYSGEEQKTRLREIVTRYLQHGVPSTEYLVELERALIDVQEYDVADSLLSAGIAENPNSAELYYRRGWVYNASNRYAAAQEDFERALQLDPHCDYIRSAVLGANFETVTLGSITGQLTPDTTVLNRLSVDSILSLSRNCDMTAGMFGGVVLLDKAQRVVFSKYRSLRRYHYIAKLVRAEAKDDYGSMSLNFNAYHEQPHVLAARTIFPDGRTADVAPDQIYVTSAGSSSNDWRTISFSFSGVDTGVVVEYIVQFEEGYDDPEELYWSIYASAYDPIMINEAELYVPGSWPIADERSTGMTVSRADSAGFSIYRARGEQLEAIVWESSSPSSWEQAEWCRFGYGQTWRQVADSYWRKIQRKIESSNYLVELATRITSGLSTREEKIDALFRFVADSIRYVAIEFGEGSTIPRPASQVLENKYGDCKDQTVLLISLLKAIGVEAYAMLATSYDTTSFSRVVANDMQFSHVVTYLPTDPPRFMDPTCQSCDTYGLTLAYMGKPGLLIGTDYDEPLIMTPAATADDNLYHRKVRMMPQPAGGVVIEVDIDFNGHTGLWLKQSYRDADSTDFRELAESDSPVGLWAASKLKDYNIRDFSEPGKEFGWTARLTVDSLFMKQHDAARANIWFYTHTQMMTIPDTLGRTLDYQLGTLFRLKDEFMIIPGDSWELDNYRLPWTMDTGWFFASSEVTEWDDSISVSITFEMKQTRIPIEELVDFTKAIALVQQRVERLTPYYRKRADANRLAALKKALEDNPEDISLLVSLADLYLGQDDGGYSCLGLDNRAKAREFFEKALDVNPKNEALILRLALLLMEDNLYKDADSLLMAFYNSAEGTVSPYVLLLLAGTRGEVGAYEEAAEMIQNYMNMAPTEQLRVELIRLHAFLGNTEEAERQIQLMETLSSDSTLMMSAKFQFYYETGQIDKAHEIVENWPDTSRLQRSELSSLLYHETENWEEALKDADELLADSPDHPAFLNNAAWYRALLATDLDRALELVSRSVGLSGSCRPSSLNTRGLVYMKMGEYDKAKADFKAALADQSANSLTVNYYFLGECALVDNDKDTARDYFNRAIELAGSRWGVAKAKERLAELN